MRNAERHTADDIRRAYQRSIHIVIGITFGAETLDIGVIVIRNDFYNAVGNHRLGRDTVSDYISDLQILRIHRFYINQTAHGIGRFHGAAEYAVYLEPK